MFNTNKLLLVYLVLRFIEQTGNDLMCVKNAKYKRN